MKKAFFEFLNIPERERKGITALLFLIAVSLCFLSFRDSIILSESTGFTVRENEMIEWLNSQEEAGFRKSEYKKYNRKNQKSEGYKTNDKSVSPFSFDPNSASFSDLLSLGFSKHSAASLFSYRNKGGVFRYAEDLQKIRGISDSQYLALHDYVMLPSREKKGDNSTEPQNTSHVKRLIDLNEADTSALIALPGIGPKLAMRIVSYRNRLGGFHSIAQLKEVYGLQADVLEKISSELTVISPIKTININTCTLEDLLNHPYLKPLQAKGIINYRDKHGPYADVSGLLNTDLVDEELYTKIAPYFSVQ